MSQYTYPSLARWIGLGTAGCAEELDHRSLWDDLFELEIFDVEPYNNTHFNWNHSHCQRSFRAQIEGCNALDANGCSVRHSTLHRYIGGHVTDLFYSPNDPLFFMLHMDGLMLSGLNGKIFMIKSLKISLYIFWIIVCFKVRLMMIQ